MGRIVYSDDRVYSKNTYIYVEPVSLGEVRAYTKSLKAAFKEKDKTSLRRYSNQILLWLCHGARIPDCSFTLSGSRKKKEFGEYIIGDKKIFVYFNKHKNFDDFLDTLIHEWVHHYEQMVFGKTDSEEFHCQEFYRRLESLLRRVKKDLVPTKLRA